MNNHLTPQQMLAYIDGELSRTAARNVNGHLHSCWTCLAEMERLKGDITTILDAQNEAFTPALAPPPQPWPGFDTVLARSNIRVRPASLLTHFYAHWTGFLSPVRIAVVSALIAILSVGIYSTRHAKAVSAKETLLKIEVADNQRNAITKNQVIRQRVHIRKTTHGQNLAKLANIDTWRSSTATYWNIEKNDSAAADLRGQYAAHKIPMDLPLSSKSIDSWRRVVGGSPSVSHEGADVALTFAALDEDSAKGIERVSLLIHPEDWHIKQMTLDFSDASFEVTEDDYAVMSIGEVPAPLLNYLEPGFPPLAQPTSRPASNTAIDSVHLPIMNLDATELDVFATLHGLKADLGDPVTVTRSSQGIIVDLWSLPTDRKNELRLALSGKTGVQLRLASPSASGRKQSSVSVNPTSLAVSYTPLQAPVESGDSDTRLVKYFGNLQKQQDFTTEALETSTSILAHLYALKILQTQFPAERRPSLSPEEQQRFYSLIRDHAVAASTHLEALAKQLAPLNTNFDVPACSPIGNRITLNWQSGSLESLGTARTVDHLLRTLLTTSQTPAVSDSALPQINQNLCTLRGQLSGLNNRIIY